MNTELLGYTTKTQVVATHLLSNCTNNKILTINDPFNKLKGPLTKSGSTSMTKHLQAYCIKIDFNYNIFSPQYKTTILS